MSKESVKQMFGKMEKDAALKAKYAEIMQSHLKETEKALAAKLVEMGKSSGFAFSNEDLLAARAELLDKTNSNKELSDNDLENVAGGKGDGGHIAITITSANLCTTSTVTQTGCTVKW